MNDSVDRITQKSTGIRRHQGETDQSGNRPARLRILDKEVQIACKAGEEDDLLQAAAYIDRSMRDLRQRNATSSIEKIAIVTAINTANALLKARALESRQTRESDPIDDDIVDRLAALNRRLDDLLAENVVNPTTLAE